MEEIKKMHDTTMEWGCITNLLDRISNIEDRIEGGWPELIDMVADAVTLESQNPDPAEIFFVLHSFLWRLYYRLKREPVKRPFNKYTKMPATSGTTGDENYGIYFYDYNTYKWAIKNGFADQISNSVIVVAKSKLTDKQQRAFERRCEEESK